MSILHNGFYRLGILSHGLTGEKEGGRNLVLLKNIENLSGIARCWPIIKGEGDNFLFGVDFTDQLAKELVIVIATQIIR